MTRILEAPAFESRSKGFPAKFQPYFVCQLYRVVTEFLYISSDNCI